MSNETIFIRLSGTSAKVIGRDNKEVLIEESPVRFGGKLSHVRYWSVGGKNFQNLKTAAKYAKNLLA